ncbi:AraC family transcriptional regulator [Fictibacillus sp. B-59209]|uniref:AraC family transcriptional regulator n=1 Tax=Fictibacillus sp. B-59209 TaxID=3024873 RepID=UPI002E24C8FF|nr:AraC family transcriptional regulator [Fictibacillus sp. B-59209]
MESQNYVLHDKSNEFYWEGAGQLSIKTFRYGRALYKTNRGFFAVEEGRYLLLNEGAYTIAIEEETEVESFCLFFRKGLAEEVLRTLKADSDNLLSDPFKPLNSVDFFEKTYPFSSALSTQIDYFRGNMTTKSDPLWKEEQFQQLMETIVREQFHAVMETEALPSLKMGTREELYRRISTAHEYIRAFYQQPVTLQQISQAAFLSTNHLLRNYSAIYGCTPHQHVTALRIEKAKQLLMKTEKTMTDIAFNLGFETPASFSKMFKQHAGISPLQFRKKVILDKK